MNDRILWVVCPYCNTKLGGHVDESGEVVPEPGSIMVCVYCIQPSIFYLDDDQLALRKITDDELIWLKREEPLAYRQMQVAIINIVVQIMNQNRIAHLQ